MCADNFDGEILCCCFTGHRNIPKEKCEEVSARVAELVRIMYGSGIRTFYAGGAVGFDMIASITIVNMKRDYPDLHLILALPCRGHDKNWNATEKRRLELLEKAADDVVYVSEEYDTGVMQKRNRYMADRSRFCICYLTEDRGGTAYTVRYAMKKGLRILNVATDNVRQLP